jgi:hypothetical protein
VGSDDNASFTLDSAGVLRSAVTFDYESRNRYSIRVRATGSTGLWTDGQFTITILDINEPPVLTDIETAELRYTRGAPAVTITSTLSVTDVDSSQLSGAVVRITANFVAGEDELGFAALEGILAEYDRDYGVLTLTGVAAKADYEAVLRSVTYQNTSDDPTADSRTVSFTVDDGEWDSVTVSRVILIDVTGPKVGLQLVAVAEPSATGSIALPTGVETVSLGSTYYVEVWAQDRLAPGVGISGGWGAGGACGHVVFPKWFARS